MPKLRDVLNSLIGVHVIIDALDECMEREHLFELLEEIIAWKLEAHLLVTSRKEGDIVEAFKSLALKKLISRARWWRLISVAT